MKHTPGPWTWDGVDSHRGGAIRGDGGYKIGATSAGAAEAANAQLIVAAPDLLEVLQSIVFKWECAEPGNAMHENITAARAAIKKATEGE